MSVYYIVKPDDMIKKIISSTFPYYRGKKVKLSSNIPKNLDSFWDGGSRNYYAFYSLVDGKVLTVQSNHPFFESDNPRVLKNLPFGLLLVEHTIYCGKDLGITIYVNADDMSKFYLPASTELTRNEKIVLIATKTLKNSYAGISNYRFRKANYLTKISAKNWNTAKNSLIEKKFLAKNGAITPRGRNAIESAGLNCTLEFFLG